MRMNNQNVRCSLFGYFIVVCILFRRRTEVEVILVYYAKSQTTKFTVDAPPATNASRTLQYNA